MIFVKIVLMLNVYRLLFLMAKGILSGVCLWNTTNQHDIPSFMSNAVQPVYLPTPYQDAPEAGRVILRDGSTAVVFTALPEHAPRVAAFFRQLSERSLQRRFNVPTAPTEDAVRIMIDSSDPGEQMCLLVSRRVSEEQELIAVASYSRVGDRIAEFAVTVLDAWQGKGLGTLLLERLSIIAIHNGFRHFEAYTIEMNRPMLDVFRHSGFPVAEDHDQGTVTVDLTVTPSEESVQARDLRDRVYTAASLQPLFRPSRIAVFGGSRDPSAPGGRLLKHLLDSAYPGEVVPVHPTADLLYGLPCLRDLSDSSDPVDLALILIPADGVVEAVQACGRHGVRAVVVLSSGFAEVGEDGLALQTRIAEEVGSYGMRMIGPNSLGLVNPDPQRPLNASLSPVMPPAGRIAIASQSGALGQAILARAHRTGLGLSAYVNMGNKADVSGNDLLYYWMEDEQTRVILLYLEGFNNPRRFARIARSVSRVKPIICVKSGRSRPSRKTFGSDAEALTSQETPVDALFRQTGVIRTGRLEDMFSIARVLDAQPLPPGRRTTVIANAAGPGRICVDACEAAGLDLAESGASDPLITVSGTADSYERAVREALFSDGTDLLIVIYTPVGEEPDQTVPEAIGRTLDAARKEGVTSKPVCSVLMRDDPDPPPLQTPNGEEIPVFLFPENATRVLRKVIDYAEWLKEPAGQLLEYTDMDLDRAGDLCRDAAQTSESGWLSHQDTSLLLEALGLPLLRSVVAETAEAAVEAAEAIGFPVAAKLASSRILRKTDVGGVALNLHSGEEVRRCFTDLQERVEAQFGEQAMEGLILQPMMTEGTEVMIGVDEDPLFGPILMFGRGGIHVELIRDLAFRITPLEDKDAAQMIREIRGFPLLEGYRGHPPADIEAIEDLLLRVSNAVERIPELRQIDFNPIFALPPGQGCVIADARVRVAEGAEGSARTL